MKAFPKEANRTFADDGASLFAGKLKGVAKATPFFLFKSAEMEYGASKSQNREKNRQALLDYCHKQL